MKIIMYLISLCCLLTSCAWILEDHNNPYEFTVTKPEINEIIGEYRISEKTRNRLKIPENIAENILVKLNSNKTFEFVNMPQNELYEKTREFKTTNEKGEWDIKFVQGNWVVPITIISKYDGNRSHFGNRYHLNKNKPPYQFLKLVGNENWDALIFDKKKNE